jgi:Xaa-Pro aminopeptidase
VDPLGLVESIQPTMRVPRKGDTFVVDISSADENYWADTTRIFILGRVNSKQKQAFECLQEAIVEGEALLVPGTKGKELKQVILEEISQYPYLITGSLGTRPNVR